MLQQAPTAAAATDGLIKDTTTQTFVKDVIEESKRQPVLVDFWADWCNPCKQLTPVLERAAESRAGKVELAKVDVEKNKQLQAAFRIQGIPTMILFHHGKEIARQSGAMNASGIESWVQQALR